MNCQDVLSRLYEIIDKEASAIDTAEVQQHLDRCRHCFDVYRLESAVQEFIHAKLKGNNPGTSLQTLKSQVLLRLDEIDRNAGRQESHRFFRRTAAVLAVAASLVILIGAGFLARDFYRHQTVYIPLERAHWASADKAETYRHEQNTSATIQGIHDRLSYDLLTNVGRYSLIGGRSEEVMDVSMAHFVYVQGDEVVSVFV
ncbi:MAG TPA: zf-HC2 domain-containing protein, partial [Candidatus Deferrimicrobium sp.]|nr:zf-HC2 domain-containing protein [Candidatus Deferrimicrobium sp.]